MKIVIVGDQQRADTWEQLLRKLPDISEVIFTNEILADPTVDGVLLIDDSEHALSRLLQSVKMATTPILSPGCSTIQSVWKRSTAPQKRLVSRCSFPTGQRCRNLYSG